MLRLAYKSIGDIGTSPLYVFSSIFNHKSEINKLSNIEYQEVIYGSFSLVFWTLISIFIVKYVIIVLMANDNGQGGTFALYSLISRYCNLDTRGNSNEEDLTLSHYNTEEFPDFHTQDLRWQVRVKNFIKDNKMVNKCLFIFVVFGTSLVVGDGILTPAVSVLSAVEGVQLLYPSLENCVVPLTIAIIIVLFFNQSHGTSKVANLFAPIICVWLITLSLIGMYNLSHNYLVLTSLLNPYYVYKYFILRGFRAWESIGGILLAVTGVEALFADLGHFNKSSIRLSATSFIFPSLFLVYSGQAARMSLNRNLIDDTFWSTAPQNKLLYSFVLIIATCSAVIASQAMVSATFSIIYQAMSLDCFPKVNVVHTSKKIYGQIFIPEINLMLMSGCILLVAVFKESKTLTSAYGLASCALMFITTNLISIVMIVVWKLPKYLIILFFVFFSFIDLMFLSATFGKIFNGGWIPLAIAVFFSFIMNVWRWGSDLKLKNLRRNQQFINTLLKEPTMEDLNSMAPLKSGTDAKSSDPTLSWLIKLHPQTSFVLRIPGAAFFYSHADSGVPSEFNHLLQCFSAIPEVVIFTTIRIVMVPTVLAHERFLITKLSIFGFYRCTARYGYLDVIERGEDFSHSIIELLKTNIQSRLESKNPGSSTSMNVVFSEMHSSQEFQRLIQEHKLLKKIKSSDISYILGKAFVKSKVESRNFFKKFVIDYIYQFLSRNDKSFYLNTPPNKTIYVGRDVTI